MDVTKEEAIATALLASMVGAEIRGIAAASGGSTRNLVPKEVDVNKIVNELKIIKPVITGPAIAGSSVDSEEHIVALHPVDNVVPDEPVAIDNPFSNVSSTPKGKSMIIGNSRLSPVAQFLKRSKTNDVSDEQAPSKTAVNEPEVGVVEEIKLNDSIAILIVHKLMKMEELLSKLVKEKKKPKQRSKKVFKKKDESISTENGI